MDMDAENRRKFIFPKVPEVKAKWTEATGRQEWFPTIFSTICSSHFHNNDYIVKKNDRKYLKDTAIPSQNILIFQTKEPSTSNVTIKVETNDELPDSLTERLKENETPYNSPIDSNVSTPTNEKLQSIITKKDSIIKQQRLQIKKIQAQNRRLKRKVKIIEDLLKSSQVSSNVRLSMCKKIRKII